MKKILLTNFLVFVSWLAISQSQPIDPVYVNTDSITSNTNNTDLKLVGQGTGLVEIEGAYTLPGADGTDGQALITNGSGAVSFGDVAAGDVTGPASSTDNTIARFDGTSGKLIQGSSVEIDDSDNIDTNGGSLTAGAITATTGASGGTVNVNGDELAIHGSGTTGMSILSPDGSSQWIFFGDASDNDVGGINYNHSTNTIGFRTNGASNQVTISSAGAITSTALTGTGDQILYATSGGAVTRSSIDLADVSTGGIQTSEVTISSANFLNINTSPVTIVSAPGAGNYIVIMAFAASMDYNSTTYSCSGNLRLEYATSGAGTEVPASTYCSSSDQAAMNVVQQTSGLAIGINQALVAKTASGDPTTGNSNIKIKVWYTIESI